MSHNETPKNDIPKNEAKMLKEIALILDSKVSDKDLQDIQNACVAGVSPFEIAQQIKRERSRSF